MLSLAVRYLGATAGIVIMASHNPKEYNGYKVYWSDGGQVPPERARAIQDQIQAITDITTIHPMAEGEARTTRLLNAVPSDVDRAYYDAVGKLITTDRAHREACRILYTPVHGTANIPVRTVLTEAGFPVSVVREQELPWPPIRTPTAWACWCGIMANMIAPLCADYGVTLSDTHTDFEFIGDKDAVMAAAMLADAVAYHKAHGRTLYDALERIWARCGCFLEDLHNVTLPGQAGPGPYRRAGGATAAEPAGVIWHGQNCTHERASLSHLDARGSCYLLRLRLVRLIASPARCPSPSPGRRPGPYTP